MPRYMLIVGGADLDKRSGNPEFRPQMLERYMAWLRGLTERGQFVESHKLYDQTGRRLTIRGGEVIDGPFIESKDAVGGIFVIEAASLDEATDAARACPGLDLQNGWVEVRLIEVSRVAATP
ncbi:MAG: transcription initiation protein [Gemmatimonadaceae bacterium]|nr:transcription initiation protein [Gemmatimonadaceae bacterium]